MRRDDRTGRHQVVFFVARYSHSGVPLAQLRLARAFTRRGYAATVVFGYVAPEHRLPSGDGVHLVDLRQPRTALLLGPIVRTIREIQPEVIFTAEDHLNVVVAAAAWITRSKAKISASSRVTPLDTYSDRLMTKRWLLKYLTRAASHRLDVMACVSKDMVAQYDRLFGPGMFQCVYNVVVDADTSKRMAEQVSEPYFSRPDLKTIVSAGRLAPEKGFLDLIEAFAIVRATREVQLLILGDGPMRIPLETRARELGVAEYVLLPGFRSNPLKYFAHSDVFVLSSYVEGMPNVLVEAMACGCTPVSTDCPTGPREILGSGRVGQLVPVRSPSLLAQAIVRGLDTPSAPESLRLAVRDFEEECVMQSHFDTLGIEGA